MLLQRQLNRWRYTAQYPKAETVVLKIFNSFVTKRAKKIHCSRAKSEMFGVFFILRKWIVKVDSWLIIRVVACTSKNFYSQHFVKSNIPCFPYIVTLCTATSRLCGGHRDYAKIRQSLEELQMQGTIFHSNKSIQKVLEIKCIHKK